MRVSNHFQPEDQTRLDESHLLKLVSIYIHSILVIKTTHKACEAVKKSRFAVTPALKGPAPHACPPTARFLLLGGRR